MSTKLVSTLRFLILGWMMFSLSYAEETRGLRSKLTDLAALSVQDKSITKLESLLKQHRGTPREPEILVRLGDLYLERSGISFRISEGAATKKSHLYKESLTKGIGYLTQLISKYPYYVSVSMAHFKRGKAYKELLQVANAKTDYLWLDREAPDFEYIDSALMDLAEFAQDATQHQEALTYLAKVEKMSGSDYYPIALHKSAWSHFNLAAFQQSHDYLKREINFYFQSIKEKRSEASAEHAFLEGAFNDLALFYFEAINKKASFANADKGIELFDKLDESNERKYFGPTAARFARLLKAYTLVDPMTRVNKIMIEDYPKVAETADVAMLVFQFHAERREYDKLPPALADLNKVRAVTLSKEFDQKVENAVSGALSDLHKLVIKNKLATERNKLFLPLISLTESVATLLTNENATALLANFSLAETSFELEEYARATQKYQFLLDEKFAKTLEGKKITRANLALRLLSSRYRELKADSVVPEKLAIRALQSKVSPTGKDKIEKINQWVAWVDQFTAEIGKKTPAEEKASYWAFNLEASKMAYEYVDQQAALTRLENFAFDHADTDEGLTAISIVLDTLAKSEDPVRLYGVTQKVLTVKNWKKKDFLEKVAEQSADSHLKITLAVQDPAEILTRTKECVKKFKTSKFALECQIIQAKTELKINHASVADQQFTALLPQIKDKAQQQSILLLRADARNKLGRLDDSIHDLYQYQTMSEFKDADITQTILQHSWFKRDQKSLDALLKNPKVCSGKNAETCDAYRVVRMLDEKSSKLSYQQVFKNTLSGSTGLATVWILTALENPKKLPFQDRLVLLNRLSSSWDHLNPLLQVHLLPTLQARVKDTLESIRISAPGIAPLTEDTSTIERRMRLMQEVDQAFAKAMKLPWLEIKLKGANELALIYERLIQDLRAIHTPEDLLKPFINKSKEIVKAIEELQGMAMDFLAVAPVAVIASTDSKTAASVAARAPASAPQPKGAHATETNLKQNLLATEIQKSIPENLWGEWKNGVENKRRDYLFYLVSVAEGANPDFKNISSVVKGMVLLFGDAPTEAYELVKSAPESPFKAGILAHFQGQVKTKGP
jgi:hypothetical protein